MPRVTYHAAMRDRTWPTVARLGVGQTLAWASTYYLPALLAAPMARDMGVGTPTVYAAYSLALLVSALLGPLAGRAIDRHGGRVILPLTSLGFAAGLAALALTREATGLFAAWLLIGLAMGAGLYEAAFATAVRLYGPAARPVITGITLIAGFASTVGWPLSSLLEAQAGWRGACLGWAALHLLVGLPLNLGLPRLASARWTPATVRPPAPPDASRASPSHGPGADGHHPGAAVPRAAAGAALATGHSPDAVGAGLGTAVALSVVFAVTWFVSTAMAAHLPALLQAGGLGLAAAVGVGTLVGPAQVAGRLTEAGVLRHLHPLLSARLATLGHPLGAVALLVAGPALLGSLAPVFAVLHGLGNGILTIAKGTLPLVLFGPTGYGARQGLILAPSRFAQAAAPLVFGLGLERWGAEALWGTTALGLLAFVILLRLRHRPPA